MADILPIRPWRYNNKLSASMNSLISPPCAVISEKQRNVLSQQSYNSFHLAEAQQQGNPERAASLLHEWKRDGVLLQDEIPAIYVYYQYFSVAGSHQKYCRKGFLCHIRAHDWDENVVLGIEKTDMDAVNDRVAMLEKTELHVSPTLGLYTDPDCLLEPHLDEAITDPLYETEDYQGVRDVIGVIHDASIIKKFMDVLEDKSVIVASGHTLYQSSLIHQERQKSIHPGHIRKEGYNFHLMYLTNTASSDYKILPVHRLIKDLAHFEETEVVEKLKEDFTVKPVEDINSLPDMIAGKRWTFGVMISDKAFRIQLKPESFSKLKLPVHEDVKRLDLTVLHYFIIEKVLGIHAKEHRSENLDFDSSFSDCLRKVIQGEVQMAFITNGITLKDIKRISQSGYPMPQKSTYFYPQVVSGFLFTSIHESEFVLPFYAPF